MLPADDPVVSSDAEAVKQHALANGPAYAHPRQVFFVNELPLSGTNKIDRRQLVARAAAAADLLRRVDPQGHIVNLGHGILPGTPLESVEALVGVVHNEKLQ